MNNPLAGKVKRSCGVSVMGWLMIILAAIQIQQILDVSGSIEVCKALYPGPAGMIYYAISVPLLFVELMLGINILRLKEWARIGVLFLVAVYLVIALAMSLTVNKNYFEYVRGSYNELQSVTRKIKLRFEKSRLEHEKQLAQATADQRKSIIERIKNENRLQYFTEFLTDFYTWLSIMVLVIKFFLWYIVAAIFFTRPKVKAQFS